MANRFRQFRLLIWKNFLLQKRRPIGTAFEIGIPIDVMAILVLIPLIAPKAEDKCFSTFGLRDIDYQSLKYHGGGGQIAFYPETKTAKEIMTRLEDITGLKPVSRSNTTGKKWLSGADMALEVSEDRDNYMGAIEFDIDEENTLPKKVQYAIRLDGLWSTGSTYPPFTVLLDL